MKVETKQERFIQMFVIKTAEYFGQLNRCVCALTPGKGHQYLAVQRLLHGARSAARRSGGGQGDGQDGEVCAISYSV